MTRITQHVWSGPTIVDKRSLFFFDVVLQYTNKSQINTKQNRAVEFSVAYFKLVLKFT